MLTYQDYQEFDGAQTDFIKKAISDYKLSELYKTACDADEYFKQKNITAINATKTIYSLNGNPIDDYTASNIKIACNLFYRLNKQRCAYSLGNGITFSKPEIKKKFGENIDIVAYDAGLNSLKHGVAYYCVADKIHMFKATELVPLYDEYTGALMAAVRFWQIADNKPLSVEFYEIDGVSVYRENKEKTLVPIKEKKAYITKGRYTKAYGMEIIGEENYSALPIVPQWGSELHQSTLVGLRSSIDAYDLIRNEFANNVNDCATIYWILENCGGMKDADLRQFRDRLKFTHIATADTSEGGKITPYAQDVPHQAADTFLERMKSEIYEGFGGLDVHTIAAGATNDHIDAAYQPLDENADDFERHIIEAIQNVGVLLGIDREEATPIFQRNRISNQAEQVDMIVQAAQYLDRETIVRHFPFITVDEADDILKRLAAEEQKQVVDMRAELEELRNTQEDGERKDIM